MTGLSCGARGVSGGDTLEGDEVRRLERLLGRHFDGGFDTPVPSRSVFVTALM